MEVVEERGTHAARWPSPGTPTPPDVRGKLLSSRVYPEFFSLDPSSRVLNLGCGNAPQAIVYRGAFRLMVGIDIQQKRVEGALATCRDAGEHRFHAIRADVERLPLGTGTFDAVLGIDVLEHLRHPERMLDEAARVLRPGGRVLLTFPAQHDRFRDAASFVARRVLRSRAARGAGDGGSWHPDKHQEDRPIDAWLGMIRARFEILDTRATTLFPPLHLYGVPRVWFRWNWLHAVDRAACGLVGLQRLGQTLMCACRS